MDSTRMYYNCIKDSLVILNPRGKIFSSSKPIISHYPTLRKFPVNLFSWQESHQPDSIISYDSANAVLVLSRYNFYPVMYFERPQQFKSCYPGYSVCLFYLSDFLIQNLA